MLTLFKPGDRVKPSYRSTRSGKVIDISPESGLPIRVRWDVIGPSDPLYGYKGNPIFGYKQHELIKLKAA